MTTTCSAPGKIYLFGEHAVVYGNRAIASAIDLRTTATVTESNKTTIVSSLGTTGIDYAVHPYISRCIESLAVPAVSIRIDSEIPVGSGLGSSAAAVIATLGALNCEFDLGMDSTALAEMGHRIEQDVQGAASPTDTLVSTVGGTVMITPGVSTSRLRLIECGIVIGDTEEFSSTKELVENVRILHERYPAVMNSIFDTIDHLSEIGVAMIERRDYQSVGELMNIDHGLLDAIGVGSAKLSRLVLTGFPDVRIVGSARLSRFVYAARDAGAWSAKITGAGGGGCIVALASDADVAAVASAINDAGGHAIATKASRDGMMIAD
ncbi:MAG: mevalonate kinase [Methanosarcinales archaeon]|nr:mevalonate kinase [Methanosarcinales archaeon]